MILGVIPVIPGIIKHGNILIEMAKNVSLRFQVKQQIWVAVCKPNFLPLITSLIMKQKIKFAVLFFLTATVSASCDKTPPVLPAVQTRTDSIYVIKGNAVLSPFGQLSQARYGLVSATAGNKILFAGGWFNNKPSTRVDIFDMVTQTWSTAELSEGRVGSTTAVVGNKIFIAGGQKSSRVDIYDASTNSWSIMELSIARTSVASTTIGNKVFFAGGTTGYDTSKSSRVDIYDASTNLWSIAELSEGRLAIAAASIGNKLFFAGGFTNEDYWGLDIFSSRTVDIFNASGNTWSTNILSEARGNLTIIALNNKVFFAGGYGDKGASNKIDIYDNNTQSWSIATLSQARQDFDAATMGNKILFFTQAGTRMDIYDTFSNTWTTADLNLPLSGSTVIRAGNHVYVAGGAFNVGSLLNQVWKLEF